MWSTLRTLQERAALLGGLVESYESAANAEAAAVARDLAKKSQEVAELLRSLLDTLPVSVVGTNPDDPAS